jgi:zinc-ribbon domain
MSASKPQRERTILTEDGELREADPSATPESRLAAVYCTNCGTSNRANSRFCRNCGESLDEQVLDSDQVADMRGPGRKSKRSMESRQRAQLVQRGSSSLAVEALTLIFVTGMVISTAAITGSAFLPIVILIVWAVVEMARHGVMN